MDNLPNEMASFLQHNSKTNYFNYIHKSSGFNQNRNEYILDMLLYSVLKSYVVCNELSLQSKPVVQEIEQIMEQEMFWDETIHMLKVRLFMVDLETYNQAIDLISTKISDSYFLNLLENPNFVPNKMKWIIYYLIEEMETLTDGVERKRAIG